ncbi:hypothetical protein B5E65_12215 [Gemmiger sp. An120]|uniref:hypothetical protein n=1 Tax=Gemmiger sp. An120 TaxID=1965549 RepID=UPI000B37FC03|nr:hypothetical protein [Gemmiger sp. An120]OUQ41393.1 hypothetical protein B5E65_12215 [Gemmiger sp. An120]
MEENQKNIIQHTKTRAEHLKNIALELVQQLKGRQLDFEDAETVLRYMHGQLERDRNSRLL